MSILGSVSNFYNDLTGNTRAEQVDQPYRITSMARKAVNLPFTASALVAGKLAQGTVAVVSGACSLAPAFMKRPYENYCTAQAEHCIDKITPILMNVPGIATVLTQVPTIPPVASGWLGTALSWAAPVARVFGYDGVADHLSTAEQLLQDGPKKVFAKKYVAPVIQSLHRQGSTLALSTIFDCAIQYQAYALLNAVAAPYVAAHANVDRALTAGEYGFLTYIYGPTAYKCANIARCLYNSNTAANQLKDYLGSSQAKQIAKGVAESLRLPEGSDGAILKITAVILTEANMAFLVPFMDNPEALFTLIGGAINRIVT